MIKKILLAAGLTAFVSVVSGQNGPDLQSAIPKIIPPSPNAAALEKFGTIPVDYSTGVPSISYPMWSWQRGKLQFSLGLAYHAGGHKVDDMASNTGLGWTLAGLGRVSRTVRGVADDNRTRGYIYKPILPQVATYAYSGEFINTSPFISVQQNIPANQAITQYNTPYSDSIRLIDEHLLDGEQDVFSYSAGGISGRFIIDKNKNIVLLEHSNTKIEMIYNPLTPVNSESGKIISFKITDDKGIIYMFEYKEEQSSQTYVDPVPLIPVPDQGYISGWLLTKIIDPATQDSIVINYSSSVTSETDTRYETGFSQSQAFALEYANYQSGQASPGIHLASESYSFSIIRGNDPTPSSVIFPDGSIVSFEYGFNRTDLLNSKGLTKLLVKNYQDAIIKRFHLNYSYFSSGSGSYYPVWSVSGNDFNKRLRLDSIYEVSADSSLIKSTKFTYNNTVLNPRGSRNIDFWGYNVDPARNNLVYVPVVPLQADEIAFDENYGLYLEGANRRPDSNYVKAAVLEKITYPTGGFTSFEYECHKAFSTINYYEDKMQVNSLEWAPSVFGQNFTLILPGRSDTAVEFLFKVQEDIEPRPEPQPPYVCLDDQQDLHTARFEIESTDNTFSTYVEDVYSHFLGGGTKKIISLPLNKTYQIRFLYDTTASCVFQYRFKALMTGSYFVSPQDKLVGGLRIKKIVSNDGKAAALTKQYDYNNPDGRSSATLSTVPDYGYYRTTEDVSQSGTGPGILMWIRYLNRSSNPTNTLNFFNGAPLIYTRVREKELDGSLTERQYDPIIFASNGGTGYYPYLPSQDFSNLSGMMTRMIIKDKNDVIKKEQRIKYNKFQTYLLNPNNRNVKAGVIASASQPYTAKYYVADQYFMYTTRAEQVKDTTDIYEEGNVLTQVQALTYDPTKYYLRTITTVNSKDEELQEQLLYSYDMTGSVYSAMVAMNMLSSVAEKLQLRPNIINGELSRTKTNYGLFQSNSVLMPDAIQSSRGGNPVQTDITFNNYDDKGNLLQYTAKDGVITSFVWGYKKQYPVAKIIGKSYSDAISESGLSLSVVNAPSGDAAMRTELNKLRSLSNCFVTTLTYKPLVGTTSETDPNGKTIYYIYDAFNRLSLIRDKDNNILKKICYNYTGQPVDCGQGTVAAWTAISSVCDTTGGGVYTGYMTVTEKDLNPASATYNQTRIVSVSNGSCIPTCIGEGKKLINGVCAQGLQIYTSSVRTGSVYANTYYYIWLADCSVSGEYSNVTSTRQFLLEPECP